MTNSILTKLPPLTNVQWLICVIAAIGRRSSSWEDCSLAVLNMLVGAISCFMSQQSVAASWAFWAGI